MALAWHWFVGFTQKLPLFSVGTVSHCRVEWGRAGRDRKA